MVRGQLRIYLGAAPGVGKTVAMLAEGARRQSRGADVVVGLCETHDRPYTAGLLTGLEVIPRRSIGYRGAQLSEMDLDAVLARAPRVALIDELAHTNVPGSRNEKRWQDIEELLAAGIDVVSTVNIQHLESLNDAVEAITGIAQQETVPDAVVRAADQIELVDMTPEALRRRLAHGNVYKIAKVDAALANYFRVGNLSALRELALLWLADRVEEGLGRYREQHDIHASWPTRERIVVALAGGPEGETLLRRGARMASRGAGGELLAVYVARADGLAGAALPDIAHLRRLTEELGGTFHTVTGDDTSEAILGFARGVNASQVVIGSSTRPRWRALLNAGIGEAVIAGSHDIDVHVVTHPFIRSRPRAATSPALPGRRVKLGFVSAVLTPALLTGTLEALPRGAPQLPLIVLLFLMATVGTALIGGLWPAVACALVSMLAINWFFTPPVGTLTISSPENALALAVFVLVAVAVSLVVHGSARRAAAALAAQAESAALIELSHTLLGSTEQLALLLARAVDMFGVEGAAVIHQPTTAGPGIQVVAATDGFPDPATAAYCAREPADDQHDLVLVGDPIPADRQRLFAAYAAHAGAILSRRALASAANASLELARANRANTALLSAVSHDLRTPLAGIKAAIGSLRSTQVNFSAEDEAELQAAIEDSADRLELLISNLLDLSRLQVGALAARPRSTDLGEVIPATVSASPTPGRVEWSLGSCARYAVADPGLLDRVLANVVENALRYQTPDRPVTIATSRHGEHIDIRVVDTGPGIPEDRREQVFQPFQRLDDTGANGVGLGLAVARGLAEAMGGTLEAENTPGGGLTMVLTLAAPPADPDPAQPVAGTTDEQVTHD